MLQYIIFRCCSTYFLMLHYMFFDVARHDFAVLQFLYSNVALHSLSICLRCCTWSIFVLLGQGCGRGTGTRVRWGSRGQRRNGRNFYFRSISIHGVGFCSIPYAGTGGFTKRTGVRTHSRARRQCARISTVDGPYSRQPISLRLFCSGWWMSAYAKQFFMFSCFVRESNLLNYIRWAHSHLKAANFPWYFVPWKDWLGNMIVCFFLVSLV
jgi:hypothetical protein